jgi:hypothetical protein
LPGSSRFGLDGEESVYPLVRDSDKQSEWHVLQAGRRNCYLGAAPSIDVERAMADNQALPCK